MAWNVLAWTHRSSARGGWRTRTEGRTRALRPMTRRAFARWGNGRHGDRQQPLSRGGLEGADRGPPARTSQPPPVAEALQSTRLSAQSAARPRWAAPGPNNRRRKHCTGGHPSPQALTQAQRPPSRMDRLRGHGRGLDYVPYRQTVRPARDQNAPPRPSIAAHLAGRFAALPWRSAAWRCRPGPARAPPGPSARPAGSAATNACSDCSGTRPEHGHAGAALRGNQVARAGTESRRGRGRGQADLNPPPPAAAASRRPGGRPSRRSARPPPS